MLPHTSRTEGKEEKKQQPESCKSLPHLIRTIDHKFPEPPHLPHISPVHQSPRLPGHLVGKPWDARVRQISDTIS